MRSQSHLAQHWNLRAQIPVRAKIPKAAASRPVLAFAAFTTSPPGVHFNAAHRSDRRRDHRRDRVIDTEELDTR